MPSTTLWNSAQVGLRSSLGFVQSKKKKKNESNVKFLLEDISVYLNKAKTWIIQFKTGFVFLTPMVRVGIS